METHLSFVNAARNFIGELSVKCYKSWEINFSRALGLFKTNFKYKNAKVFVSHLEEMLS